MLSNASVAPKRYVDREVQTDPELRQALTPPASPESQQRSSTLSPVTKTEELTESEAFSETHSRESTHFGSAYSHPFDRSNTPSPEPTLASTTRLYKATMTLGRTKDIVNTTTSRIVSLPETVSMYSAKTVLKKSTSRVVSMPLSSTEAQNLLSGTFDDSYDEASLCIASAEGPSRVRVQSQVSEMPHTPSPPSSPESVVIIGNKNHLAENFLRGHRAEDSVQRKTTPDPEGWISWASSPPRPIPALHGPLSLPYARCPSGAEGTILEEPDNIPRMIWGLEGEDLQPPRSRPSSAQHPPSAKSPQRGMNRVSKTNVPPRLQKAASDTSSNLASQFTGLSLQDSNGPNGPTTRHQTIPQQDELVGYPLRGQEPIDLAELLREELELDRLAVAGNNALENVAKRDALPRSVVDWPGSAMLGSTKDNNRFSGSGPTDRILQARSRSQNAGAGSLDGYDVASQYSPALMNHIGYPLQDSHRLTPRRQTALEIAQQYRQQQLQQRQLQSALPTPPNSSSPIWSSSFSPYPSSVFSPELLSSASGLPKLSPTIVHSRSGPTLSDVSQHLRQEYIPVTVDFMPRRSDFDISSLAPMAHAEDLQELYATSPSLFTLADSVEAYVRDQARRTPNEAALQALISRSPAVPRPPPNTPLTAAASRGHSKRTSAPMTSPPSPPSPQQMRVHTFSTQQTRSIPLARLMQRRLSAVPEEDALSQLDEGLPMPTPDVYPRSRSHSLNPGPPDVQTSQLNYLLSPAFSGQHTRVSDPRRGALLPGTSSSNDSALLNIGTGQVAVQVKLPGAHTRGYAGNTRTDNRNHQAPERRELGREESVRNSESARGGSQRRGGGRGRGKSGRNGANRVINGPERVDGGLMVKS